MCDGMGGYVWDWMSRQDTVIKWDRGRILSTVFFRWCWRLPQSAPDNSVMFSRLASNPLSHRISLIAASNLTAYIQRMYAFVSSYATCMLLGHRLKWEIPPLPQSTTVARIRYEEQWSWKKERVSLLLGVQQQWLEEAVGSKGANGITQY